MTTEAKQLAKAFEKQNVVAALQHLYTQGVLDKFGPFSQLAGMTQGKYHHLDALEHSFEVVRNLKQYGVSNTLMLAGLFHDIGKAHTRELGEDGKIHFIGHENYSQDYLRAAAKKYDFAGAGFDVPKALILIKHHMLEESRVQKTKGRKRVRRDIGNDADLFDLIMLKAADKASGAFPARADFWLNEVKRRFELDIKQEQQFSKKDLAITGKDLLDSGIPAGRNLGKVLDHIFQITKNNHKANTKVNLMKEAKEYAINTLDINLPFITSISETYQ